MNILSIDHGDKRIGFAIGNSIRKISTPLTQITNSSLDYVISQIKSLIIQYEIEQIIIGIPFNEDGGDSLQSLKVRDFAKKLIDTKLSKERIDLLTTKKFNKENDGGEVFK